MAKDDFFVITYRILSYLYACFKAGEKADLEMISPDALHISSGYWINIMECLSEKGYITGIVFPKAIGGLGGAKISNLKITMDGIEFLQENSSIKKAVDFLKTVKEIVPGF